MIETMKDIWYFFVMGTWYVFWGLVFSVGVVAIIGVIYIAIITTLEVVK